MKKPTTRKDMAGRRKPNLSLKAQRQRILEYLQTHDTGLNRYEAERLLNVCQLAARVFELKADGHRFLTLKERAIDPHGIEHRGIARYYLEQKASSKSQEAV